MKKKTYVESSREQSVEQTYLIGLKWNQDDPEDFKRRWENRPLFVPSPYLGYKEVQDTV